jgi:cis-3-alkyl-4-acyloxetan-2-one decarboxylase
MRTYTGLDVHSDFGGRFPWKSRFVEQRGIRQAYVDEGPPGAPVTFVCLHGNPTWGFLYREFVRRLSAHHRIIAVDHVGFGRSDKPRDPAYYSIARHVENLEHLLAETGATRVIPIVHDWGGPIGLGWATRHPQRVAGLVVLNTTAFADLPVPKLPWPVRVLARGWRRAIENSFLVEWFVGRFGTCRAMGKEDLDPYRAPFPTPAERVGMARMPNIYQSTILPHRAPGWEPWPWSGAAATTRALPTLREKPAVICWAQQDRAFKRPHLERWRRTFADVDGPHLLPNAAHFLQEDAAPAVLDHVERWVAEHVLVRRPRTA